MSSSGGVAREGRTTFPCPQQRENFSKSLVLVESFHSLKTLIYNVNTQIPLKRLNVHSLMKLSTTSVVDSDCAIFKAILLLLRIFEALYNLW